MSTRLTIFALFCSVPLAHAQSGDSSDTIRVRVSINADGSRTTFKSDPVNRKASATITEADGKLRQRIDYDLDDAGHFRTAEVFGGDNQFRFKALYKYDSAGRVSEEKQLGKDDSVQKRVVYSYDKVGKTSGYVVYDGAGKIVSRVNAASPTPTAPPKTRPKNSR